MSVNTVFIVGAGASTEVDFPTTAKLKGKICSLLSVKADEFGNPIGGDDTINQAIQYAVQDTQGRKEDFIRCLQSCITIRQALPLARSIDEFIHSHRGDNKIAICGKLAIAKAILDSESSSKLKTNQDDRIEFEHIAEKWYAALWRLVASGRNYSEVTQRLLSIGLIIFRAPLKIAHFMG